MTILTKQKKKLSSRAEPARYLHGVSETTIAVQNLRTAQTHHIRAVDFAPYNKNQDPSCNTIVSNHTTATPELKPHIPPFMRDLSSTSDARKFPDAAQWATTQEEELRKLDKNQTIQWIKDTEVPAHAKPIPLKMTYRYNWSEHGSSIGRKARCSARGDKMQQGLHYDSGQTTAHMADKASIRPIFAVAAQNN